ncbi:MAG TPA: hypothetical protein VLL98_04650 [Rickettsiales bacterium]|nr:hypothetical protein [Rickettsiales bacterium]
MTKIMHTDIVNFEVASELLNGLLNFLRDKNNNKYNKVKKIYSDLNIDNIENTENVLKIYSPIMKKIKDGTINVEDL